LPPTAPPATLFATLGSEPQVITAVLDLLLERGERIQQVSVVHTVAPGTQIELAVETITRVFSGQQARSFPSFTLHPIIDQEGHPLSDVEAPEAAQACFRLLYTLVRAAKLAGLRVHLSIAGGRKSMAVFGMAAAQLLFDENDRLWHLFSAGDFLAAKRLHPEPGDEVHLIPIPVILWSQVSPVFTELSRFEDPYQAVERVSQLQIAEKIESARAFVLGSLTAAERRVVEFLVRGGLGDQEIAARLSLSPRTVERHLRTVYLKAADHWELPDVGRTQLVSLLNVFYLIAG
jgi:CRISPR-associated Csx14 family protein